MNVSTFRLIARSKLRNRLAAVLICALSTAGCSTLGFNGSVDGSSQAALRQILDIPQRHALHGELLRFYAARDFRPVWTGSAEARARAASVIAALEHADRQGLQPRDYAVDAEPAAARTGDATAWYDLKITASLLRYARDVRTGRVNPKAAYSDAQLPVQNFDAAAELEAALDNGRIDRFFAELPPQHPQYRALAGALARYQAIAAKGGWPRVSRDTPQRLAKRLALEDAKLAKTAQPSTADVKAALQRFQARYGLQEDGVLGGETLKALNVPVSTRIAQIAANMERWRWLPRRLEDRYIQVDVPEQTVDYIENGKRVLHSRAIIGRDGDDRRTPILRTVANAVVVNPPWDIPDDIAVRTILPHLRKNPNYLATRNMVLIDAPKDDPTGTRINWREVKADNLPYQIREQPGPNNALGALMLDMPNDFDVYLHGTSNATAFKLKDRERSHGCVRVEKAVDLAALALKDSISDPQDRLARYISSGQTQRMALDEPIPVYMFYWTAYVGKDGAVAFRPDRYERDPPLIARLRGQGGDTARREAAVRGRE